MKNITGLNNEQVERNRKEFGSNKFSEKKQKSFFMKYLESFKDPIIGILCVAVIINVVIYVANLFFHFTEMSIIEIIGIVCAVLIATFVSTKSEDSSEKAFQKLQEEASKIKCKVIRNGSYEEISIDDIVYRDVVLLQAGDKIPADGYIISGSIKVDQSSLNGESEEVTKEFVDKNFDADSEDLSDRRLVFRGTIVESGEAIMEVLRVGDRTISGKLAQELQEENDRETPLKVKLTKLADGISKFGYIGGILIAVAFTLKNILQIGFGQFFADWITPVNVILQAIILAVIVIVVAVPEGLPLMISIVSSLNMKKMLKDNVLVRKINGIETAGSLNILFTDKTGTLTTGKMTVEELFTFNKENELNYVNLRYNTDVIYSEDNELNNVGGNSTDRAIMQYLIRNDYASKKVENSSYKPTNSENGKIKFTSANKYSAIEVAIMNKDGYMENIKTCIKGAAEVILSYCTKYVNENGEIKKITKKVREQIDSELNKMTGKAMRVLALAYAEDCTIASSEAFQFDHEELIFTGLIGIRDSIRPTVPNAVKEVKKAGVQVVMITGDNIETAKAIALDTGIMSEENDIAITSQELNSMTDEEVKEKLHNIKVVARALPSDKSRLVKVAQQLDLVAGMTGDGVNDSPALKKADVGFAMGSGTEVAKEAGDIVILDDNFSSIEKAILYGRTIFNNIRKFITFQLTINVSAVLISFLAPLLGLEQPITVIQMLWVNLVMDTLAALAFGGLATEKRYMKEKPKSRQEHILNGYMKSQIGLGAIYITIISLLFLGTNLFMNEFNTTNVLLTGYFTTFIMICIVNSLNVRTEGLNLLSNVKDNLNFFKVMGIIVIVQILMTYFGGDILRTYGLNLHQWIFVIILSLLIIPLDLVRKFIISKKQN